MWIIFYMVHSVLVRICIKSEAQINPGTARAAQMFLGALPTILAYLFLQMYFTKRLVIGSKGAGIPHKMKEFWLFLLFW